MLEFSYSKFKSAISRSQIDNSTNSQYKSDHLPVDIVCLISTKLDVADTLSLSEVCVSWNNIIRNAQVWHSLLVRDYPIHYPFYLNNNQGDMLATYIELYRATGYPVWWKLYSRWGFVKVKALDVKMNKIIRVFRSMSLTTNCYLGVNGMVYRGCESIPYQEPIVQFFSRRFSLVAITISGVIIAFRGGEWIRLYYLDEYTKLLQNVVCDNNRINQIFSSPDTSSVCQFLTEKWYKIGTDGVPIPLLYYSFNYVDIDCGPTICTKRSLYPEPLILPVGQGGFVGANVRNVILGPNYIFNDNLFVAID